MTVRLVHYIMHKHNLAPDHVSNGAAWQHSRRQCAAASLACMWIDGMQCPSMKWRTCCLPSGLQVYSHVHHIAWRRFVRK